MDKYSITSSWQRKTLFYVCQTNSFYFFLDKKRCKEERSARQNASFIGQTVFINTIDNSGRSKKTCQEKKQDEIAQRILTAYP
uniref:Uncharacterized protein n=1 Tax=Rhizophora mucronata TaxID=61149 RepID=A0A2P2IXQ8_RHIMU